MRPESLVEKMAETLPEVVGTKKIGDILGFVNPEAPVVELGDTLAGVEAETIGETLNKVDDESLVHTKAERVWNTLGDTGRHGG